MRCPWGERDKALADYTAVIDMKDAPAEQRAWALFNRGVTHGKKGERDKALADYTVVIDMKDVPAEQRAKALRNRGVTYKEKGEREKALADYTAVIDMKDAPRWLKTLAGEQIEKIKKPVTKPEQNTSL